MIVTTDSIIVIVNNKLTVREIKLWTRFCFYYMMFAGEEEAVLN